MTVLVSGAEFSVMTVASFKGNSSSLKSGAGFVDSVEQPLISSADKQKIVGTALMARLLVS
jgi:hypothetical protein